MSENMIVIKNFQPHLLLWQRLIFLVLTLFRNQITGSEFAHLQMHILCQMRNQLRFFITDKTSTTYNMLSNLVAQETLPKDINNLTMEEIAIYMKKQFDPKRFVVERDSRGSGKSIQKASYDKGKAIVVGKPVIWHPICYFKNVPSYAMTIVNFSSPSWYVSKISN